MSYENKIHTALDKKKRPVDIYKVKRRKFGNIPTIVNGVSFDSKREVIHYNNILARVRAGEVTNLIREPKFPLIVSGKTIGHILPDFSFFDKTTNKTVLVDVKGVDTAFSKWKRKHFTAQYGSEIEIWK